MKSKFANFRRLILPLCILGLVSTVALAGVSKMGGTSAGAAQTVPGGEPQRAPGDTELPTSLDKSKRNQSDSVIRCWQEGRLIFDERNWNAAEEAAAGPVLYSTGGSHSNLRLMQFGDTFCTLKYGPREP